MSVRNKSEQLTNDVNKLKKKNEDQCLKFKIEKKQMLDEFKAKDDIIDSIKQELNAKESELMDLQKENTEMKESQT